MNIRNDVKIKIKTIILVSAFFLSGSLLFAKKTEAAKPDWVENWCSLYPDEVYIAQLGKAAGKKSDKEAKNVAANNIAQFIQTTVQSEIKSSSKFSTSTDEKGRLVTSREKDNSQNITLSVDLALTSVEFTDPWYNKKEKIWYCLAYVTRQKLWEQYQPSLQNARDRLFTFYEAAEKSDEPLYKMIIYKQSQKHEKDFYAAYSFSNIISPTLTDKNYGKDRNFVSSITAKAMEEKNKSTFVITVTGDIQNIVYQSLKDSLGQAGYSVKNEGEEALYSVNAVVNLDDNPIDSLHIIKPSLELFVEGKTASIFSYAKQTQNVSGLNEGVVKMKAVRTLSSEINNSFLKEFGEKIGANAEDAIKNL